MSNFLLLLSGILTGILVESVRPSNWRLSMAIAIVGLITMICSFCAGLCSGSETES